MKGVKIFAIDATNFEGKRLRGELLNHLKDRAGLEYREIVEMELFIKFSNLRAPIILMGVPNLELDDTLTGEFLPIQGYRQLC